MCRPALLLVAFIFGLIVTLSVDYVMVRNCKEAHGVDTCVKVWIPDNATWEWE